MRLNGVLMSDAVEIYCDGGGQPGGPAGYGWVAKKGRQVVECGHGPVLCRPRTSNVAEYQALLAALRWAKSQGLVAPRIHMDSELVVSQVTGRWACRKEHLKKHCEDAQALRKETGAWLIWVPRTQNQEADALAALAVQQQRGTP
jgi:ribonuclease H / adenosylcobalamin/alpha-ribazole phosphatase